MNDIYWIKLFDVFWFNYWFLIIFFWFLIIYLIFIKKKIKNNNIISQILSLKSNDLTYKKIDTIFREYFEYIWINKAFSKTLEEFKGDNIKKEIISLFEKNYKMQFSLKVQNKKQNENILNDFKNILKDEY